MPLKNINRFLISAIIAVIVLALLGSGYHYLAGIAVKRADSILNMELEISDVVIEKGYAMINGKTFPHLIIEYRTSRISDSHLILDGKRFDGTFENRFSYNITFPEDMFEKSVELAIVAEDAASRAEIKRSIELSKRPPKADISIIS